MAGDLQLTKIILLLSSVHLIYCIMIANYICTCDEGF